jgi:hypothetical protein
MLQISAHCMVDAMWFGWRLTLVRIVIYITCIALLVLTGSTNKAIHRWVLDFCPPTLARSVIYKTLLANVGTISQYLLMGSIY